MNNPVAIGAGGFLASDVHIESEAARMAVLSRRAGYVKGLALVERCDLPPPRGDSCFSQMNRMKCHRWWTKQLRRVHWRRSEQIARESGEVWKSGQMYCSDHTVARFRLRNANAAAYMAGMAALNPETGDVVKLGEAAAHNLSNPSVRRSELMARTKGMESYARSQNWRGEFWTISTPSRFHARTHVGRKPYQYKGATPSDARDWLQRVWSIFRASLSDAGVEYCALRIAEPHHDGTPHLHILIFLPRDVAKECGALMANLAMRDDPPKNQNVRFKAEIIRNGKGESAAGYVIKYVCKAVDGHDVGYTKVLNAETGRLEIVPVDSASSAERVRAWASLWGIRQFQFSGLAKVGPYRELRRVDAVQGVLPDALVVLHKAANDGSFVDYLASAAATEVATFRGDVTRGEYGDQVRSVQGILFGAFDLTTREEWEVMPVWMLDKLCDFVVPVSVKPAKPQLTPGGVSPAPWTRLNNCREDSNHGQSQPIDKPPWPS